MVETAGGQMKGGVSSQGRIGKSGDISWTNEEWCVIMGEGYVKAGTSGGQVEGGVSQ